MNAKRQIAALKTLMMMVTFIKKAKFQTMSLQMTTYQTNFLTQEMMSEQYISKNKKEIGVLIQLVIQQEGLWRDSE